MGKAGLFTLLYDTSGEAKSNTVNVYNSIFYNNGNGTKNGGAIFARTTKFNVQNSNFTNNGPTNNHGGAIKFHSSDGTIIGTSFVGNKRRSKGAQLSL